MSPTDPMRAPAPPATSRPITGAYRHPLQISVLVLLVACGFVVTRVLAAGDRAARLRDAADYYARGRQSLALGRTAQAAGDFRRAVVRARDDKRYGIALAEAAALEHQTDAAWNALSLLRDAAPDDPEINLALARLAVTRGNPTEAARLYHNALYAPWPAAEADARRHVRIELIRMLLANGRAGSAQSELLALATDLPDTAATHLEVADLFADAGDHAHALEHYQRSARLAPDAGDALAGIGREAFQLGQYQLAQTSFRRAPADARGLAPLREITDLVLSGDPLAAHLGTAERGRRLAHDGSYAAARWTACLARQTDVVASTADGAMTHDLQALSHEASAPMSQDEVESAVELIERAVQAAVGRCGPATPFDQALLLIAHRHAGGGA